MADDATALSASTFKFHPLRDRLLAEAHARPPTPLPHPTLASRIANLSGEGGQADDWAHMVALCRKMQAPEPAEGARWCVLDAGKWRLRWERHTEVSTWTFYRPLADGQIPAPSETALDLAPSDWLTRFPGEILVAAHVVLLRDAGDAPMQLDADDVASDVAEGSARVWTDFRPGPDSFTRFQVTQEKPDAVAAGRIVQRLFEIETYRLMALLAFPMATETATVLSGFEAKAERAAIKVGDVGDIGDDRRLLERLASLAGEAQALAAKTNFRFAASQAYYGLVLERIAQLREERIDTRPTIAEFMERRLAPAMRTCTAVRQRQETLIQHIGQTTRLLSTRVGVATESTNANLLASMDRRAKLQLQLQELVEGLSVVAISYYALGILKYAVDGASAVWPGVHGKVITAIAAPIVIGGVWIALRWARGRLFAGQRPADSRSDPQPTDS